MNCRSVENKVQYLQTDKQGRRRCMTKTKYYGKENTTVGTHSFYTVPVPNGLVRID